MRSGLVNGGIARLLLVGWTLAVVGGGSAYADPACGLDDRGVEATTPAVSGVRKVLEHPRTMTWLVASFGALQTADVISTRMAIARGLEERNPLVKGFAGDAFTLTLVKASVSAASLVLTNRLAKRHRMAGALLMAGLDGTLAIVAARNLHLAHNR